MRTDNGCYTCRGGSSPIAIETKEKIAICEVCLDQIRLAHSLGRIEEYKDGQLISRCFGSPELQELGIAAWSTTHHPKDRIFEWWFLIDYNSRGGWSYAYDQLYGAWSSDAQNYFYERWTVVALFFNHYPRTYEVSNDQAKKDAGPE